MAEPRDPHYEETEHPRNPPEAVLTRRVRRSALGSYLGTLVVLFVIIGLALLYWSSRGPGQSRDDNTLRPEIGTTGEQRQNGAPSRDLTQGGGDPAPRPGSTQEELEFPGDTRERK